MLLHVFSAVVVRLDRTTQYSRGGSAWADASQNSGSSAFADDDTEKTVRRLEMTTAAWIQALSELSRAGFTSGSICRKTDRRTHRNHGIPV